MKAENLEKIYDKKYSIKYKDMAYAYNNEIKENPVIYEVYTKAFSPIDLGLTVIHPGDVKGEFFMTKGHIHAKKTPEFYILLEGKGLLIFQKNNKVKKIKLKKGEITLIPEGYAHRSINIGDKKLKILTVYHEDSWPNYKIKFQRRFFKK